jgi:hypothetical protein
MGNVALPPSFAKALPKSSLKKKPVGLAVSDISCEQLYRIGKVIELDATRRGAKQPPNNDPDTIEDFQLVQYCARIAT